MPTYEYRCEKCGDLFEVRQKFSDAALTQHEICGGPVQRVLSAPALQFKGSGWYITDYAKSGNKSESNGPSEKSPPSDKSDKKEAAPASSGSSDKAAPAKSSETKTTSSEKK